MPISNSKILFGFIVILYVLFSFLEFIGNGDVALYFEGAITLGITLIYIFFVKKKDSFFLLFLILYSIADLFILIPYNDENLVIEDIFYSIENSLYILAYISLTISISKSLDFKYVFKNLKAYLITLIGLNLYMIYVLQMVVKPKSINSEWYFFELFYNIIVFLLLTVALLNYIYKDNKKSMLLFLGVLLIVFSEVIDVAILYVYSQSILSIIATTLSLAGFYFLYKQSRLLNKSRKKGALHYERNIDLKQLESLDTTPQE